MNHVTYVTAGYIYFQIATIVLQPQLGLLSKTVTKFKKDCGKVIFDFFLTDLVALFYRFNSVTRRQAASKLWSLLQI